MLETEQLFRDMTGTLTQARRVVEGELELLAKVQVPHLEELARLEASVGELSSTADSLLVMMYERDAEDDLMSASEALVDFFRDMGERITLLLGSGQGSG
jgi:hypothetical protein